MNPYFRNTERGAEKRNGSETGAQYREEGAGYRNAKSVAENQHPNTPIFLFVAKGWWMLLKAKQ